MENKLIITAFRIRARETLISEQNCGGERSSPSKIVYPSSHGLHLALPNLPIPPIVLFVGGGSIGHIAPSVAVWEAFQEIHPGSAAHFVCADHGDDTAFLRSEGCHFTPLSAPRISFGIPWKFFKAVCASKEILRKVQPDIIFSKGGYVSLPLCFAARGNIPIVLHESDAVSGRANAIVQRWADRVCLGFPKICTQRPGKAIFTGNPIRRATTRGSRDEGLHITKFSGTRPILLILGGSQGARDINTVIVKLLPKLTERFDVIHITGRGKGEMQKAISDTRKARYHPVGFADAELPHFYACADVAISRAGASSIAELGANGIPTILVPLRGVAHDHQEKNARAAAAQSPLFTVIEQGDLEDVLVATTTKSSKAFRASTSSRASKTNAARHIAEILVETLEKGRRDA